MILNGTSVDSSLRDKVNLPTRDKMDISYIGQTSIFKGEMISNVFHVLDFKFNLLSISKKTRAVSCFVAFFLISVYFRTYVVVG